MKVLYITFLILCLVSCKKEIKNHYFKSEEIYNTVIQSTEDTSISKSDKTFYVLNRYDTLIIMSSKHESTLKPTLTIRKIAVFKYKDKKIIITQPYNPIFEILKTSVPIKEDLSKPPYYDGADYQKGFVYKIKDLKHLELIAKGDIRKYFYPIKEYEIPAPPPPKEYVEKSSK